MQSNKSQNPPAPETYAVTFLVVGGGIAGVTCAETLAVCCPEERTLLLTESSVIKTVANLEPVARYLYKFDVKELSVGAAAALAPSILTVVDQLQVIEATECRVTTAGQRVINYKFLCLCTGAAPHLVASNNPRVLGIRDTDSVLQLQRYLRDARRVVLLGNGGIASELAHELHGVEVHWVVKDNHISSTFVDPGAAHFFEDSLKRNSANEVAKAIDGKSAQPRAVIKRLRYSEILPAPSDGDGGKRGAALGPDWHRNFELAGSAEISETSLPIVHYQASATEILPTERGLRVTLSTGEGIDCDFLVSATGVMPRHEYSCTPQLRLVADGGIAVSALMETNVDGIYAAGDVCTASWEATDHWFQMRLWTQARQMGAMAGRSMAARVRGEQVYQDFCFEIFGHVTELFGFPMVLLGRFNGQGLGTDYELLLRSTPGKEYIKFVLQRGRLRGAILIGNTELAETCENLILNGIDLTPYGDDILNPDIDIEDYFD